MLTAARGALIERRGLTAQITAALRDGSVVLVAGAGYGKTTALRQALDHMDGRAAWVRCRDASSDAGRLLALIVEAIRLATPGAADALAERIASVRAPIDSTLAAVALEREMISVLVEPLVIVFDDAEAVTDSPAAVEVIARLLVSESPLLRVALASRHRPGIRLAREHAAGRLTEFGSAELAFTAADCAAYLRQSTGRDPDQIVVEALLETTDGWPLGVALAASDGDGDAPGPSPDVAHKYFSEEVLSHLDADLRAALLVASVAPDLDVAEHAGLGPRQGFAAAIDRHALFVRPGAPGGRDGAPSALLRVPPGSVRVRGIRTRPAPCCSADRGSARGVRSPDRGDRLPPRRRGLAPRRRGHRTAGASTRADGCGHGRSVDRHAPGRLRPPA